MPHTETYRKTLEQAAQMVGGELNLSVRLRVDLPTLETWLSGRVPIPESAFLYAVDVITVAKLRAESSLIEIERPRRDRLS